VSKHIRALTSYFDADTLGEYVRGFHALVCDWARSRQVSEVIAENLSVFFKDYRIEYYICLTVHLSFIWLRSFGSMWIQNLSRMCTILPFFLYVKCPLAQQNFFVQQVLCKFWFTVATFIITKVFLKYCTEGSFCPSDIRYFLLQSRHVNWYVPHLFNLCELYSLLLVNNLPIVLSVLKETLRSKFFNSFVIVCFFTNIRRLGPSCFLFFAFFSCIFFVGINYLR
jgi:hypothetical protein